ncbi:MAG: MarR family winged helix-turn-helix transcriptional regulator [Acidimicrobiia bacterium]
MGTEQFGGAKHRRAVPKGRAGAAANDAEAFGLMAGRTLARLAKQVEWALTPFELTLPQYRLLALLSDGAAMSSSLAERLAVKPPTVTSVVDGLVTRGLVERQPDPTDRRRLPLALTDEGTALVHSASTAVGTRLFELLDSTDEPATRDAASRGLYAWQESLDAHRARLETEKEVAR